MYIVQTEFFTAASRNKQHEDPELVRRGHVLMAKALYVLQQHCAATPLGYFTDVDGLKRLEKEFDDVRVEADALNAFGNKTALRVTMEVYPLEVEAKNERVRARLRQHVLDCLEMLYSSLRCADKKQYRAATTACRNIHLVSENARTVGSALDAASKSRRDMRLQLQRGEEPEDVGDGLDLRRLEAAIREVG